MLVSKSEIPMEKALGDCTQTRALTDEGVEEQVEDGNEQNSRGDDTLEFVEVAFCFSVEPGFPELRELYWYGEHNLKPGEGITTTGFCG
jgi:hypothetical protein